MKLKTKELVICAMFASITAVLAQISIPLPFTTVPLTMQVFAVAISGVILGCKKGFISQVIYILLGAIGIPVFAQMSGGMGVLFGYTGGFIIGFPLMSLVIGYISEKYESILTIMIAMIISLVIEYTMGTIWYSFISGVGFMEAIVTCVAPFVVLDLFKVILATTIGITIRRRIKKELSSC